MKRLLIVDDERHSADRIATSLNWEELGIATPDRAYDAEEAKRLLSSRGADIMLCDIEMPGESGLELIAWARSSVPELETVILTCHADFSYAREAIRLGSFDYLIKPVSTEDLRGVFARLIDRIDRSASLKSQSDLGKHWLRNRPLVVERFLLDLVNGLLNPDPASIEEAVKERGLPFEPWTSVLPILMRFHRWDDEPSLRERRIREHEGRNTLGAELSAGAGETDIVRMEKEEALAVVRLPAADREGLGACYAVCEHFAAEFSGTAKCAIGCYIGEIGTLTDFPIAVRRLRKLADDNVSCATKVLSLRPRDRAVLGFKAPDLDAWKLLLENGAADALRDSVAEYLRDRERANKLDASSIAMLRQDFMQLVHIILGSRGVSAHLLPSMAENTDGELTVQDTLRWTRNVAEAVASLSSGPRGPQPDARVLAAEAERYIRGHLADDLSRESIADRVGLNSDYFGRVFRKETGLTVTEYVVKERVSMAIRLLEGTDQSISRIAEQVGYTNFAYFSQLFRKATGFTPSEYQRRHRKKQNTGGRE
ncbi:MAG: helix-turn-helix domain-containing protein [Treponemataceae bacterium]